MPPPVSFFIPKAPGSFMPLAANAQYSYNSTRAPKARLKENAKHSKISIAAIAHHTPAITASVNDRVRFHAAEPSPSATPRTTPTPAVWYLSICFASLVTEPISPIVSTSRAEVNAVQR